MNSSDDKEMKEGEKENIDDAKSQTRKRPRKNRGPGGTNPETSTPQG